MITDKLASYGAARHGECYNGPVSHGHRRTPLEQFGVQPIGLGASI
jgi:hypothetical protein